MREKSRERAEFGSKLLLRFFQCLCALIFFHSVNCDISGYYFDNGYEQTMLDTAMDPVEREVMQEEILHLLGLHYRPHSSSHKRRMPNNSTVPTFMKDIYHSLLNQAGDSGEIKNLTFIQIFRISKM